ncbi:hypothetical protein GF343_00495 [Candidatus Woesearchaeota archaeon]|nr:hypothetical protein [Candidatus Woesearchaeota archaeon]
MSEDSKLARILEKIGEKRLKSILCAGMGAAVGSIDCISSGLPILTTGLPILDHIRSAEAYEYGFGDSRFPPREYYTGLITYALSASIPFIVKYHTEIAELTDKIL